MMTGLNMTNEKDQLKIIHKARKELDKFLEQSAYSIIGESGETKYEKWSVSPMYKENRSAFFN